VLEVGRVEAAGRPDDHGRLAVDRRRHRLEGLQQQARVVADRADAMTGEQLRHQPRHRDAVLEDVGDARGGAHVVLQDAPDPVAAPYEVAPGHVGVDAARRADAVHGAGERRSADDQRPRHDAGPDDLPGVVDVVDEGIERADPLSQTALDHGPLIRGQDAGHQVERERAVTAGAIVGVDLEGDALLHEDGVAALARGGQRLRPQPLQRGDQALNVRPGHAVVLEQFIQRPDGNAVVLDGMGLDHLGPHTIGLRHRASTTFGQRAGDPAWPGGQDRGTQSASEREKVTLWAGLS
jgi:hypothetical protein